MDFKKCPDCELLLDIENFYTYTRTDGKGRWYSRRCRPCEIVHNQEKRRKEREDSGGSTIVPHQPNEYTDDAQKKQTFETLQALGWKFNKDAGIWYDNKIKDKNGNWLIKFKVFLDHNKRNVQIRELVKPNDLLILTKTIKFKSENSEFESVYDYFINKLQPVDIQNKYGINRDRLRYLLNKSFSLIRPIYEPKKPIKKRFLPINKLPYFTFKTDKSFPQDVINSVVRLYYHDGLSLPEIIRYYPQYDKRKLKQIITKTLTIIKNERKSC